MTLLRSMLIWQIPHLSVVKFDSTPALFSSKKFYKIDIIVLSFIFDKYCPIIDYLGSKDSFHKLQLNCAISYFLIYI
jgi:hypothetical protein